MPAQILIDANAYLDFYRLTSMRNVLPLLEAVGCSISLPKHVVDEVQRNKVGVTMGGWPARLAKARDLSVVGVAELKNAVPDVLLPPELRIQLAEHVRNLEDYERRIRGIGRNISEVAKAATESLIREISRSEDHVSRELESHWKRARGARADEIERARSRRERGNPPGKKSDPLGDQLTWEQFLSDVGDADAVWIITKDGDYFDRLGNKRLLNPLLLDDLRCRLGVDPTVYEFTTIYDGLTHFADVRNAAKDERPTPDQVKEIEAEAKRHASTVMRSLDEHQFIEMQREDYLQSITDLEGDLTDAEARLIGADDDERPAVEAEIAAIELELQRYRRVLERLTKNRDAAEAHIASLMSRPST